MEQIEIRQKKFFFSISSYRKNLLKLFSTNGNLKKEKKIFRRSHTMRNVSKYKKSSTAVNAWLEIFCGKCKNDKKSHDKLLTDIFVLKSSKFLLASLKISCSRTAVIQQITQWQCRFKFSWIKLSSFYKNSF